MILENWKNISQIFTEGGSFLDGQWYDNEEIPFLDLPLIKISIGKPVRTMTENEAEIIWYANGDMNRKTTYNIFPPVLIDNLSALNVYGQKVYNNFILEKQKRQVDINESIPLYDEL